MIKDCLKDTDVVVLAGGRGTRVASVLKNKPKILAPLGKRLFIDLLLNWLEYYGAKRIIFSLGFLSESIVRHLESIKLKSIEFKIVVEESPMGTGGAIRNVRGQIETDPILVVNGDTWLNEGLVKMSDSMVNSLAAIKIKDSSRYGTIEILGDDIVSFKEKNKQISDGYINAGMYHLDPSIFKDVVFIEKKK